MNELTLANLAFLVSVAIAYFAIKYMVKKWDEKHNNYGN